jgi:SAM-dependent methyltransferase
VVDPDLIASMTRNEADIAFRRRVRTILEWVQPRDGDLVLDAPCGRGFYLKMLRHASGARLVGADLDDAILAKAQGNVGSDSATSLGRTDLQRLPFRDSVFDGVICSEGLEHVEDDLAAMRELGRVAKPGATIVVTVPNADYPFWWDPINRSLEDLFGCPIRRGPLAGIWANHLRLYRAGELRRLIERVGLEVEEERSFAHHCFPFSHNIVYGIGKPLLESGVLPDSVARTVDRSRFDETGLSWNPLRMGVALLQSFDRKNQDQEAPGVSTVSLCVKSRKPGGDGLR